MKLNPVADLAAHSVTINPLTLTPTLAPTSGEWEESRSRSRSGSERIKSGIFTTMLTLLSVFFAPGSPAATHTWTGASGDGKWSTAGNWSGGAPVAGEAAPVILQFPVAGAKFATNDLANLTLDQIQISGDNYRLAATGVGTAVTLRSQILGSTFFISGANTVLTNFNFTIATNVIANASAAVSPGDTATFRCRFTGPGGFIKQANGTLVFDGNEANTYAGRTWIHGGTLELSQSGNAIPGDLEIGHPALANPAAVTLLVANQIADAADVLVNSNGVFSPGVFTETIGSLTLSNADQVAGIGLTLNGPLTSVGTNTLTGTIRLGGASRTFDITGHLNANAFIENLSGSAGLIKTGDGTLELSRANTYNGTTSVEAGRLLVSHAGALGTAGINTSVDWGATVEVAAGLTVPGEPLNLAGRGVDDNGALILQNGATWSGQILLTATAWINVLSASDTAYLVSQITGTGTLTKIGRGALWLRGNSPNNVTGVRVSQGDLWLDKPIAVVAVTGFLTVGEGLTNAITARVLLNQSHQIADSAAVTVDSNGELNLSQSGSFTDVIETLTLRDGTVAGAEGTLILKGDVTVYDAIPSDFSQIDSRLSLGGASRTFSVQNGGSLGLYGPLSDGGNAAGLTKTGPGILSLHASNSYAGLTVVSEGMLGLSGPKANLGATTSGTMILSNAELRVQQGVAVTNETLTLDGLGTGTPFISALGNNVWAGPIALNSPVTLEVGYAAGQTFEIRGAISGPGSLQKVGGGDLKLTGPADNTFAGLLTFERGLLDLHKTGGAVAIPGPLTIGTSFENSGSATVRSLANHQIDNGVVPTIRRTGRLDLNGFNDSIGGLDLRGGDVTTGAGVLTLLGDINTRNPGGFLDPSSISGKVSLGGALRTFNVGADGLRHALNVAAELSDGGSPAGFKLVGGHFWDGTLLELSASNSFSGPVIVGRGSLLVRNAHALGTPAGGTTVSNSATLKLIGGLRVAGETLTLEGTGLDGAGALESEVTGTNTWSGPIILAGVFTNLPTDIKIISTSHPTNCILVLDGPISGPAKLRFGGGRVILAGSQANTYSGATTLTDGEMVLAKTNAIAVPGNLTLFGSRVVLARDEQIADDAHLALDYATLDLNSHVETVGSFSGNGTVAAGTGTFRAGHTNEVTQATFSGTLTGSGSGTNFVKYGASRQTLAGTNACTGTTQVEGGLLIVNGCSLNTATFVHSNAVLAGTGTVGDVIVNGGTVSPGAATNGTSYGKLTANGNVTFKAGSKLRVEIGGTDAGVNCDQFVAGAQFNLAGGALETALASGTTATNDQFVILKTLFNNSPAGVFAGLPEASFFNPSPARTFQITYAGGDGNDIMLTQLTAPQAPTMSGIVKLDNGTILLGGVGSPGLAYTVLASTNLVSTNWVNLGSITADGSGAFDFIDNDAPNFPMRFYRFLLP